jgi:hypothetical protein
MFEQVAGKHQVERTRLKITEVGAGLNVRYYALRRVFTNAGIEIHHMLFGGANVINEVAVSPSQLEHRAILRQVGLEVFA